LEAKQNNYNNQILRSNTKIETIWKTVKAESGKRIPPAPQQQQL
jgi:hypothetical protein